MTILYDIETGNMCECGEATAYLCVCRSPNRYMYVEDIDEDTTDLAYMGVDLFI